MKKYFKTKVQSLGIMLFIALAVSGISCKKFLEPTPKDVVLESNFPKNYWDAEFMLRGVYQAMQPLVNYRVVLGEMKADWVTPGPGANNDILELANHKVTDQNHYTDWQPFYTLINRANYAIKNIPRIPLDSNYFSSFIRNQYIGEARFLRCYGYFHLIQNFDKVPFIWEAIDDISKVDTLFKIPPSSQDVILDSLEADLKKAFAATDVNIYVPNSFDAGFRMSGEQTIMRVRKQAVAGLQAEIYLWRNKYADAVAACQAYYNTGIDNVPGSGNAAWFDIFRYNFDATSYVYGEQIFRIKFDFKARETNDLMMLTSNDPASGGRYMIAPSLNGIKTYNPYYPDSLPNNNLANEIYRGFGASYTGSAPYYNRLKSDPVIWKFLGLATVTPGVIDVPQTLRAPYQSDYQFHIFRQADLYLLWAEALNRAGDKANAISRINLIRGRAGMPTATTVNRANDTISVNSSVEKIENYILRERGLELGYEGRRWYDLMRMARHRGTSLTSPDTQFIIDAIKKRAPSSLYSYLQSTLSDVKNLYLPYNSEEKKLNPKLIK
ncbi:RagB/SusD family nutrient uptake outer membrane protein [Ferruginibacter sp.]